MSNSNEHKTSFLLANTEVNMLRKLRFVSQLFPVNGSSNPNEAFNAN